MEYSKQLKEQQMLFIKRDKVVPRGTDRLIKKIKKNKRRKGNEGGWKGSNDVAQLKLKRKEFYTVMTVVVVKRKVCLLII